jgi:hypothetical protein
VNPHHSFHTRFLLSLGTAALLSATASADLITGMLVTSTGAPVAFADIDAKNNGGGGDPTLINGGTDALGQFFTTIPAGNYDLTFTPPLGVPGLVLTIENVTVAGTLNLGTIALPAAHLLSGVCVDAGGSTLSGINIDVIDAAGDNIDLAGDTTDGAGAFTVAVPPGAIEVRFDAFAQSKPSKSLQLSMTAANNLGTLVFPEGNAVVGIVRKTNGAAVPGCDIDVFDASGAKLYTPGDSTDASGVFNVLLAVGSYRFEFCPPFSSALAAKAVDPVVVSSSTNLGIVTLQTGVVLSGSIKSHLNVAVPNADIDLFLAGTSTPVVLCGDNANGAGNYQVIVPLGTYDAVFSPPGFALALTTQHVNGIVVSGNKVQNGVLPACPFSTSYGSGLGGTSGVKPLLSSSGGAPRVGNPSYAWTISQAQPASFGVLGVGFGQLALPLLGGTVLIDIFQPYTTFTLFVGGAGSAVKPLPVSITPSLVGVSVYAQYFGIDAGAPQGISMSNGLQTTFCE